MFGTTARRKRLKNETIIQACATRIIKTDSYRDLGTHLDPELSIHEIYILYYIHRI